VLKEKTLKKILAKRKTGSRKPVLKEKTLKKILAKRKTGSRKPVLKEKTLILPLPLKDSFIFF